LRRPAPLGIALLFLLAASPFGCAPVPQPLSNRFVAALEVHLASVRDRQDFVDILRRQATRESLDFEDVSDEWRDFPEHNGRRTIYIGLYRRNGLGKNMEVMADNWKADADPWVMFLYGKAPGDARRTRDALIAALEARWPDAHRIPATASGGLPQRTDLVLTAKGYAIKPDAQVRYQSPDERR